MRFRGHGIAGKMYHALFENRKRQEFCNKNMVHQLFSYTSSEKNGVELVALLPDERGEGIDTVYYFKEGIE
jgi:hypothetical protein